MAIEVGYGGAVPGTNTSPSVLSIPAGHPYVDRIWSGCATIASDPTKPWWPHPGLTIEYLDRTAGRYDVVHVHFGFEHRSEAELREWTTRLETLFIPLIVTVHDLQNPHLSDQHRHLRALGVLVQAATQVVTLTDGAAAEVERRWGVRPVVVPHPPLGWRQPLPVRPAKPPRVGLDYHYERANLIQAERAIPALAAACRRAGAILDVRTSASNHHRLVEFAGAACLEDTVTLTELAGGLRHIDFETYLGGLDLVVLPYLHGTHSGRVELCDNLGVRVLSSRVGFLTEQCTNLTTLPVATFSEPNPTLSQTVCALLAETSPPPLSLCEYDERLSEVRAAYETVLNSATARVTGDRR